MNVRPIERADLDRVLRLLVEAETDLYGQPPRFTLDDVREWVSRSDLAQDSWVYESDEEIAALGWMDSLGGEVAFAVGVVHPARKGQGLGTQLAERAEDRARMKGATRVQQHTLAGDTAADALFTRRGYHAVRRFYDMAIELDGPPEVPDAAAIETLRAGDERAFHAALEEAFQDHWEFHPTPFEDWWERRGGAETFDPTLWFLIRDGGEIAAVARNEANRNGGGYVGHLAVRRAWRGRGYAKALLLRTFREFWDRGVTRVTLGVDAESPTGATHLYERVGMHVETESVIFEKELT